jgi:hypothetical protein
MPIIFNAVNDIMRYVDSQTIEFGKHGNPPADFIIELIRIDPDFRWGEDVSEIVDRVFNIVLGV